MNSHVYELLMTRHNQSDNSQDFVFTLNGKAILDRWITHKFKKYVKKRLPENTRIHFHSLRASFATWLVQDGVGLYEVQKLLGHSSNSVTQVYSHLAPNELYKTVNRLNLDL